MPADGQRAAPAVRSVSSPPSYKLCSTRALAATVLACALALAAEGRATGGQHQSPSQQPAEAGHGKEVRLIVPPVLAAKPSKRTSLPITIASPGDLPRNIFVRLRGLPPAASLSEGHGITAGVWAVPLSALGRLEINVPVGVTGRSEVTVSLVTMDGALLAETKAILTIEEDPPQPASPERLSVARSNVGAPPSAARAAAPSPAIPMLTREERERAEKLVARGELDLEGGNIALARNFFLRAAEAGLARAALLLAATYDARELARMQVQGVQPNPALARQWYERARELGSPEASERLSALGGN
jgi:hypothetical protein